MYNLYFYYYSFVIPYVMVSPISNTMVKLHDSWIKFIIITVIIILNSISKNGRQVVINMSEIWTTTAQCAQSVYLA